MVAPFLKHRLTFGDVIEINKMSKNIWIYLADLGEARGCSTNTSLINSLSDPLVKYIQGAATP